VEKSARYAVPFVKNLKNMLTNVPPRGYNTEKLDRGNGLSVLQSRAKQGLFSLITLLGSYQLFSMATNTLKFAYRHLLKRQPDHYKNYG
jgi:hypothetical protein